MADDPNATLLDAVFAAAGDAIVIANSNGIIQRVNTSAADLFGYEPSGLLGQNVKILMPSDMAAQHDGFMRHHMDTGERRILDAGREVIAKHKSGNEFPLHLNVGRAERNGEVSFVAVMHDLSRRNFDRAALARSQRLDAIGQMTGGIAHDFNNLLAIVIGNLEFLEMRLTEDKQCKLVADALEAAELGADLTSRLLVFARQSDLKPEPVDLREICRSTIDLLASTLGAKFRIEEHFDTDVDRVQADAVQLQSALVNLVMNARDAMPEGGTLSFALTNFEVDDSYMAQEIDVAQGSYVRLSLSDTGGGMATRTREQAFEPFFTTKPAGKGTGLGLAMVHGFVRQSGGHVTLYSEVGEGTTVSLYFPALDHHADPARRDEDGALPRGQGQVILVVEDDDAVRRLTIERLHDLGYRTQDAATADEAWMMLEEGKKADLVFTDLMMPGALDGRALAQRVAEDYPTIKILLTSGYAQELVDNGHIPLLRKPYRQSELAKVLHALLAAS